MTDLTAYLTRYLTDISAYVRFLKRLTYCNSNPSVAISIFLSNKASLLLVAVFLEQSDIVVDSDEALAVADGFVTISGFLLQLYKVLFVFCNCAIDKIITYFTFWRIHNFLFSLSLFSFPVSK